MKKTILVTGGAGFVGSNLIKKIINDTSYSVISLDDYSSGSKKNHYLNKRIKYIRGHTINIVKILDKYKKNIFCAFILENLLEYIKVFF